MTERMIDVGPCRLWTARTGIATSPPVILSSGGPGCCDCLGPVAGMIDDLATIYRWEQRGCGHSDAVGPYDVPTCLADLEALREAFGCDQWIVAGESWGANLSLTYATEYSDRVAGLIFISGTGLDGRWRTEYHAAKGQRSERHSPMTYPPNMDVNAQVNQSYRDYLSRSNPYSRVADIRCPALFIHGSADLRPAWASQEIAACLPQAQFHIIEGAEHVIWLTHADALRKVLRTFVGALVNTGPGDPTDP